MARKSDHFSPLVLRDINHTLELEGKALFNEATRNLHRHYDSVITNLIELDPFNGRVTSLSYSTQLSTSERSLDLSTSSSITQSLLIDGQNLVFVPRDAQKLYPNDPYLSTHDIESFVAYPLKSKQGELLGILYSAFGRPIPNECVDAVIDGHAIYANIISNHLTARSLTSRADSLVEQLSYEVSHDNLTGLYNRSFLSDKLEQLADLKTEPFTLAYIDINNFKSINDLYGNYIGDRVINYVAEVIKKNVKNRELAFRISGDEFAFITLSGDPFETCNKIIKDLDQGYRDSEHNVKVAVSIGLARHSNEATSADQTILNASLALKDCKRTSHLNIQCYDTHLSAQYYRRAQVIDALRAELDNTDLNSSEIYVVVQPIVNMGQKEWNYYETLARWESSSLGSIAPFEFIEAAEQSGLIVELGERIVELACQAKKQLEAGLGYQVRLSINCSAHELTNANRYLKHLLDTIQGYGFSPYEFTIELTETVLIAQKDEVKGVLNQLRFLGFKVALDDFGTGYSSLSYIHSYPIDCIKIDATFIREMLNNQTSERLVWLIIQLAQQLEMDLVAEGVEHKEALDKLHSMGCTKIQGYYFSRPELPTNIVRQQQRESEVRKVSNG